MTTSPVLSRATLLLWAATLGCTGAAPTPDDAAADPTGPNDAGTCIGCGADRDDDSPSEDDDSPSEDIESSVFDNGALASSPLGVENRPFAPATLAVRLRDAPGDFEQVPVTISSIEAHITPPVWTPSTEHRATAAAATGDTGAPAEEDESGGAWHSVVDTPVTVDLLTLQDGLSAALGAAELAPGMTDQIRLVIADAAVVVDGETHQLHIPSGAQTGLKLDLEAELAGGADYELMLDFDAHESVMVIGEGNYRLQPVITVDYFGPPRDHDDTSETESAPIGD